MRPLNGSLFRPACALRVSAATARAHLRARRFPVVGRRQLALVVIVTVTVSGWSSRNRKTVPCSCRTVAVRPRSSVEVRATENTLLVSVS
jgi:hypothetical protein